MCNNAITQKKNKRKKKQKKNLPFEFGNKIIKKKLKKQNEQRAALLFSVTVQLIFRDVILDIYIRQDITQNLFYQNDTKKRLIMIITLKLSHKPRQLLGR